MKGRDALRELLTTPAPDSSPPDGPARRSASGAIKAMNMGLQRLTKDAEDAKTLRAQLMQTERVVDLDPAQIDASIVADRLARTDDPDFLQLCASVAEHGQQVPILVRPHADKPDRYQAAYGHRRLQAARKLGRPVKAIVRSLSDRELVIAQGNENNKRRDLTFIERALFAFRLEQHQFDRTTIQSALGVDNPELSRLLSVAGALPMELVAAIGPAPKIGRPRWLTLVNLLKSDGADARIAALQNGEAFHQADSDERFVLVLAALQAKPVARPREILTLRDGRTAAKVERTARAYRITTDLPAFQRFLSDRMPALVREFEASQEADANHSAEEVDPDKFH